LTGAGLSDIFLAILDPNGGHTWSKGFGGVGFDEALGVDVDGAGNVTIAGYFSNAVDFGGGKLTSAGSSPDIFVARFSPGGGHLWSDNFGDSSEQYARGVAVDGYGNASVAGFFAGTLDFGDGGQTSVGSYDIFVAKFVLPEVFMRAGKQPGSLSF
jgi:hypothetical protein